jgi:hypothetical protein
MSNSILKKLQKVDKNECIIKSGVAVLLDSQEQLNLLAEISRQYGIDDIVIDGRYVAFSDEINAINVVPLSDITEEYDMEAFEHKNLNQIDFDKWYKRVSRSLV